MQDLKVTIGKAYKNKELDVTYNFNRVRQCSIKGITTITDVKGQIVFSKNIERLVNGNLGQVEQMDHYHIDDDANIGLASFDMYLEWQCPLNVVHQYIRPISLKYSTSFVIREP